MITDLQPLSRYFDSIHRRTLRDNEALPPAGPWAPDVGEGEKSWSIARIVHPVAESRMHFARAHQNHGWDVLRICGRIREQKDGLQEQKQADRVKE